MTNAINNGLRERRPLRKDEKPPAGSNEIRVGTFIDDAGTEYRIMQDGSRRRMGPRRPRGYGKSLRRMRIKMRRENREFINDAVAMSGGEA